MQSGQQVFWHNEIKKFRKRRTRTSLEKRGRTKKRRKDVSWEGEGGEMEDGREEGRNKYGKRKGNLFGNIQETKDFVNGKK